MVTRPKFFQRSGVRLAVAVGLCCLVVGLVRMNAPVRPTQIGTPPELDQVRGIFPTADSLQAQPEADIFAVFNPEQQRLGTLVLTSPAADDIVGYGGPVPLLVGLDAQGRIAGVAFLQNWESGNFVDKVQASGLLGRWLGQSWEHAASLPVDTITGATRTSHAVIESLRYRLALLQKQTPVALTRTWDLRDGASLFLALLGVLACFIRAPWRQRIRDSVLVLSVAYLGFYRGTFLSIDTFSHWIKYGVTWAHAWLLLTFTILALGIGWFWGRPWYCQFVCPMGAAQELLHRISRHTWVIPGKALPWLRRLRWVMLATVSLLLILDGVRDFTPFEPFTAFSLMVATPWVLSLAGLVLLASWFTVRPWCRFFCPTGALLETLRRKHPHRQD